jgi:cell pole-organizing protein PopZ
MSANASLPTSSLDAERRAHEPSMEEILASIRRIIADDDSLPVLREDERSEDAPAPEASQSYEREQPAEPPAEAVSERSEPATTAKFREERWPRVIPAPPPRREDSPSESERRWASSLRPIRSDFSTSDPYKSEPAPAQKSAPFQSAPEPLLERPHLEAAPQAPKAFPTPAPEVPPTLVSVDAAATVSAHFQALAATTVMQDSDFLHRCAQEILRPMLKQWLDDNLPVLVERLVRAEIERVARGRR